MTNVPSGVEVHECRDCGCVHVPDGVTSAAFVRSDRETGERVVARSLRDWLQSRRPEQVVVATDADRRVIEELFGGDLPGVIGNIDVADLGGTDDRLMRDLGPEDRPVLRGTALLPSDVREVGAKVVLDDGDAPACEVSAVRRGALAECRCLVRVLASC